MLVACWCLGDAERRDELRTQATALRSAYFTNWAMWNPKALEAEQRRFDTRLSIIPFASGQEQSPALAAALAQLRAVGRLPPS